LVQTEGEVEALCVIVATSVFDGEGVASEPLYWVLLRIVLGNPQRFEFLWEQQIAKSSKEGGEAVVLACRGGFLASDFFNSAVGIVIVACDTGDVAVCVASAYAITSSTGSPSSPVCGAPTAAASAAGVAMSHHGVTPASATDTVTALRRSTS
jgi:hypothetical protein